MMNNETPQIAAITMRLAQVAAILTVPYTLELGAQGEPSYSEESFDVDTIRLIIDEEEYKSDDSYEQIAEIIEDVSTVAKLDVLNFWEQVALCWVVGCNKMGYSNFGFHQPHKGLYGLSPAYGLVATAFAEEPNCEMKLSINGKRRGITRTDLEAAMKRSGLRAKIINGIFNRFISSLDRWCEIIDESKIADETKNRLKAYITLRVKKL